MARRLVIADASPVIGLAAAGAFDVLHGLFGQLTVPKAVQDEVMAGAGLTGAEDLRAAVAAGWIRVVADPESASMFPELGPGEASVVARAIEQQGPCLVLMDDALGRARAREAGVVATWVVGVLLAAKTAGHLDLIRPCLDRLAEHGFRVSPTVIDAALERAGET